MISRMFAVQDLAAGAFLPPFLAPSEGVACRYVRDSMRREGHPFAMNPSEYVLYEVGEFDDSNGMCVACQPRSIAPLVQLIKTQEV